MPHSTRIYTKTGDQGNTHLASGKAVSKGLWRIEAMGVLDELNAHLGLAAHHAKLDKHCTGLEAPLIANQNKLFDWGALLAAEQVGSNNHAAQTQWLEDDIDKMSESLPPLKAFILPGGPPLSAQLHIARTVCRRAERVVVRLSEQEATDSGLIAYLNRLGDWLFMAARYALHQHKVDEVLWEQDCD